MSPAAAIAALDRAISHAGETVTVRRYSGNTTAGRTHVEAACKARVTDFKPEELTGDISHDDAMVVMSPTQLAAAGWTGGVVKGDRLIIRSKERMVEESDAVLIQDTLVRYNLRVRG